MSTYYRTLVKDFNGELLHEQVLGILPEARILWAGFRLNDHQFSLYGPNAGTKVISSQSQPDGSTVEITAEPGEMKWRFPHDLTPDQEASFDSILNAHDSTQKSIGQQRKQNEIDAAVAFKRNFDNWGSLSSAQRDNNLRQLTRFMARLLDDSTDV